VRDVLGGAGSLILRDIARDGRLLVARTSWRLELYALRSGDTRERDLTWLELSVLEDVSPDGKRVLFFEQTAAIGPDGALCVRGTDGSPVVRLGKGGAGTLSPDGKSALILIPGPPQQMVITPLGAGQPRELRTDGKTVDGASWLPDGKRILWFGAEPGKPGQAYIQELPDGLPKPILKPELNPWFWPISPDGLVVPCRGAIKGWLLCSLSGADAKPIPGLALTERPLRWTPDGKFLYISGVRDLPLLIYKLEVATGRRQLWKEVAPADLAGVSRQSQPIITPDGQTVVYQLQRTLSDLFVVEGVK
jgi:hypothetical protein